METVFQNLITSIQNQTVLTQSIQEKLQQLEINVDPSGITVAAINVSYDNTQSGTDATNVQVSLDEIYALIGDINTVLDSVV